MWAMFVKTDTFGWRFEGLTSHEEKVTEFEESVAQDIESTKDSAVHTLASFVVELPELPVPSFPAPRLTLPWSEPPNNWTETGRG